MYSIRIATLIPQQELLQLVLLYFNCWILTIFEDFHPTKDQVDDSNSELEKNEQQITKMMEMLQSEYVETQISELVQLAKENEITSRNSCFLTAVDILRLLLSLRYNGLETGVYRHVAMLNHNCHPNCSKLLSGEVRTTKTVHPGEFLTISYLPHIMSHSSRRKHIWEQHRFDIGASLKGNDLKMELIGTSLPKSSIWHWDETSLTRRVEKTVEELQNLLDGLCLEVENGRATPELWETAKALEQSSLELYTESTQQLKNTNHILLLPCLSIHLEACDLMQKAPSFSVSIHLGILSRQALTAIRLLSLQALNLGPDHFDLARTNLDIANAVGELLSRSPKHLYDLNVPILRSFQDWSAFEHKSRKEYDRIKALYPHDVGALIKQDSHQL